MDTIALLASATTVTTARTVDEATAEEIWDLYVTALAPLHDRAAARQVLNRSDFALEVLDARVTKYLARDDTGALVGLCTITNDLETVPWISPRFYELRYPEHFADRTIFYCGLAIVHPEARQTRALTDMAAAFGRDVAVVRGVLTADMCRYNIDVAELARTITLIMRREWGQADLVELDRQVYMAWGRPGATGAPSPGQPRRTA
jgi:hypothetical protein